MTGNNSESSSDTETESGEEEEEEEEEEEGDSEEQDDDGEDTEQPVSKEADPPEKRKGPRNLEQIMMDCELSASKQAKKEQTQPSTVKETKNTKTAKVPKDSRNVKESNDSRDKEKVMKPTATLMKKKQPSRGSLLTGRGVTTQMLIDEQILEAGEKCLTINYLGKKFVGDLNVDGTIKCGTAKQIFSSPSAWAMHCKKQVNPDKKSGCGWASVKYKGRKLDEFKSTWFHKQKIAQQVAASSENDSSFSEQHSQSFKMEDDGGYVDQQHMAAMKSQVDRALPNKFPARGRIKSPPVKSPSPSGEHKTEGYVPPTSNYLTFSEALQQVQRGQGYSTMSKMNDRKSSQRMMMMNQYPRRPPPGKHPGVDYNSPPLCHTNIKPAPRKRIAKTRISVKYSLVQPNSDLTTLVECAQFQSTGKIQPFSITISTSTLLLIDFHCHLTMTEVSGYIAGTWDVSRQHLRASVAYPCKYDETMPEQEIQKIEEEIRNDIETKGHVLLGWYHSHPFCQPDPSLNDIRSQLKFQDALRDGHYEPCVGLIVSPYDSYKKESQVNAFWVRPPSESNPNQVGLPLSVRFTTHQDQVLTQAVVNEMVDLVNYYSGTPDVVRFSEPWSGDSPYIDKLKHSVIRKFPQDQTDGRFLDFIHKMLMGACS